MRGKYGQNITGKHAAAGIVYARMRYALCWPFKVKRATFFTVNDICMQLLRVCGQRGLHKAGFHCIFEVPCSPSDIKRSASPLQTPGYSTLAFTLDNLSQSSRLERVTSALSFDDAFGVCVNIEALLAALAIFLVSFSAAFGPFSSTSFLHSSETSPCVRHLARSLHGRNTFSLAGAFLRSAVFLLQFRIRILFTVSCCFKSIDTFCNDLIGL